MNYNLQTPSPVLHHRPATCWARAALASLLGESARTGCAAIAHRTAFRAEGQTSHLSAHGRWSFADGPVRLQAGDAGVVRQGAARIDPHGPASDHDDQRSGTFSGRAVEVQIQPGGRVRHVDEHRTAAESGEEGRRNLLDAQPAHRSDQSRTCDHRHANRQSGHRSAVPGIVGLVWLGQR